MPNSPFFDVTSGNVIMQKTMAQLQADWVLHAILAVFRQSWPPSQTKPSANLWKRCLRASVKQLFKNVEPV